MMRPLGDPSLDAALAARREIFGDELVDRNYVHASDFTRPVQDWLTGAVWADVWTRHGLDRRTRSLLTLALLTALNRPTEFASHTRAAVANGCTVEEIREVLLHTAPYCGAPAALQACRDAERVLTEIGALAPGGDVAG